MIFNCFLRNAQQLSNFFVRKPREPTEPKNLLPLLRYARDEDVRALPQIVCNEMFMRRIYIYPLLLRRYPCHLSVFRLQKVHQRIVHAAKQIGFNISDAGIFRLLQPQSHENSLG